MKMDDIEIDIETGTEKSFSKIDKLISKLKSLVSTSQMVSNTNKKISESISPTVNKMNDLNKAIESTNKTLSTKPKLSYSDTWKQLQKLKDTYSDLKNTVDLYNSTYPKGTAGEKYLNQPLQKGMSEKGEVVALNMTDAQAKLASYESKIKELEDTLKRLKDQSRQPLNLNTKQAQSDIKNLQKDLDVTDNKLKKTKNRFGLFKGLGVTFTGISTIFSKVGDRFGKTADSMLNKIKKFGLGLLTVRTAMSVLTKAVSAYLSFDGALSDSITNSWNMLGSLLAPAIEMVAQLFATATTYVYTFVKALTGIDFVARANAKALKTQTAATKAAAQAQRSLSSMDEITNLQTDSAGGGGGNIPQIEVPQIEPNEFFSNLIDLIKKGDWYGVGKTIAEGLNKAMYSIPWDKIKKTGEKLGINLAKLFNGFIENVDWYTMGTTLGNGLQTAINFAYGFVTTFNWGAFGKGIGNFINGAFDSIEWDKLGKTISEGIKGALKSINSFLETVNWENIGKDIRKFLENIDWVGIGRELMKLVANGMIASSDLIDGLFATNSGGIFNKITGNIAKKNVMGPGLSGLVASLKELKKIMANPEEYTANFIEKINNMAISVSEKFSKLEEGAKGLIEGFTSGVDGFFQWLNNGFSSISNYATNFVKDAINTFTKSIDEFFNMINTGASNLWNGITNTFQGVVQWFVDSTSFLFNTIKTGAINLWNNIKNVFSNVTGFFGNIINKIKEFAINIATSVGNVISGAFKAVVNSVLRAIENILNFPIRAINSLINVINKVPGISLGKLNTFNLPRLATGTNEIPQEGIYHLHEGEAVVPKKYNPATGGYDNGADNRQIIELLVDLNANMLALSEREMAVYMDSRKVAEGIYDDMQTVTRNKNVSGVMKRS